MRGIKIVSLHMIIALIPLSIFSQKPQPFYNVDKEIKVEGTIVEIMMEPRYENSSPFLVVLLEKKGTKEEYFVEVSPIWFFERDFHKGENMSVVGSLYVTNNQSRHIIAREMRSKGETIVLRDKHGFPNWRGGKKNKRIRRKGWKE